MQLRKMAVTLTAGALLVGGAIPALADDTNVTVTGGSLSNTAVTAGDFGGITLDGTAQSTTATIDDFSVTDATGSGDGWKLTVQATQFAEHNGNDYVEGGKTLAENSLSLGALTATADGTTSPVPTMTAAGSIDNSDGAVKFASAAVDEGMGKYEISGGTDKLSLSIPASAYAKTYRSTLTVTLATTP